MADEVPVNIVLCEAMEYLCKLGSNLRTRSENLREKRISKEKLKNSHAVRKAASKLLMICELSKKSLENVENGVKNVLKLVDASNTSPSVGAKRKNVNTSEQGCKQKSFYFEYDSCKLRISKKIYLKHYTSVKVLAKSMPMTMLDKYPVFHDCSLYRRRKSQGSVENNEKEVSKSKNIVEPEKNNSEVNKKNACSVTNRKKSRKSNDSSTKGINSSDKDSECGLKSDTENRDKSVDKAKLESDLKDDKSEKSKNLEDNKCNTGDLSKNTDVLLDKFMKKKEKRKMSAVISDTDDDETMKKTNESQIEKNTKLRRVKVLDDSSNESSHISEKTSDEILNNESQLVNLVDEVADSSHVEDANRNEQDTKENVESDSENKKPFIKLVSLNKLLKPDILQKEGKEVGKKLSPVKKTGISIKKQNLSIDKMFRRITKKKDDNDVSYWEQKRKEVSAFKPKKFDVVVIRLPKYSDKFLNKYGLKKITHKGSFLYVLTSESSNENEKRKNGTKKTRHISKKLKMDDKIGESENPHVGECVSLSNSDSGNDVKQSKKFKNELLKSSDDDLPDNNKEKSNNDANQGRNNVTKSNTETAIENQDTLEEKDPPKTNEQENPKTPPSNNKQTEKTTPHSKRKLIMESMHAKKMLLTYSSSSDTEDDMLRNVLKEVKNSLLNLSSSENEGNNSNKKLPLKLHRRLASSTDSDNSVKNKRTSKTDDPFKEEDGDEVSRIDQIDGTNDEMSNSSSSKMGRSKTKVASSSKQNTESPDRDELEINRLSDLKSLTRPRRRREPADEVKSSRTNKKMPKAPLIKDENMLAAESSSDAVSETASDHGEPEELPPIPVQELNGSGIEHLAKEDLLAQSDSSSSHEKTVESEEDKKENESDEEDSVKITRRKANTISSDSEAGSSRKKADKMSDFEDSEEESSEPAKKKNKRKKKETDSDTSLTSNDGSKKKRRRIKQVNESDGSGSDTENEGKNKHGRKNIRKVMGKNQLEEATKKAARQEKERKARIAERQKMYNNLEFDESGKPDEVVLDKVVLDFDPETKQPLIEVDRGLVKKLKPHQANGIKFMWNACFESVKRIKKDRGSGCILAHCMGLGKTLQVVSLTHTLLTHGDLTGVRRVLVVCPLSTVLNWVNEFNMWLKHAETDKDVDVFELSRHKQNSERSWQLQQWYSSGGVCVLGYEMFRNLSADNSKKFKKKMLKTFQEALVDPGPDLVVCDEGHLLKNEKTSLSQSMNRVRTLRRIVLTGTPLQNNLKEYYCMVQFVKPNLLGKYNEYLNRFVNPITNGQYTDSTERDISIMKRRSHVLHTMLDGAVQRRDYGVLAPFLPPKHEYVLFITLTDIQVKLYQHYLDNYSRRPLPGKSSGFLFPDFQSLQRIWTHPLVLKYNSERYEIMQQKKRDKEEEDSEGSLVDFIDDDSTPDETSTEESSDDLSDVSDDSRKKSKKKKSAKKGKGKDSKGSARRGTRANPIEMEEEKNLSDVEEVKYENPTEWWMKLVSDDELEDIRHSAKLLLLFDILRQCEAIGDKLLVFSQSLYSLDLIEHFLGKVDEATQEARIDDKLAGHVGLFLVPGVDYFRLDGSTSCENRSIWCKNFNREDNPRARLFLISTRAGGLGINLVAANRVVIFDVSWNPSHDVQSIFRVYRFGQKKPCYIYRFLAMGTMEEKIYERQVTKQAISKRVIDEQQIDRHYAANDLAELYKFEPVPEEPRPVPSLPKDRLFAEMLKVHEKQIYKFHEHDSLLENKEEETLSEEERKKAWEEFENEKRQPPPSPFPSTWSMHNGVAASLLQQQQQQLAYAALASMLRKDMPNINDNQIRDMLPIICNANPGLMQKMSEIYKYTQPGMMNPSMMNPVMNAGGGMSTTSSLQYEPPWQRQQQQQQQMRLQQIMQQQHNSLGAKYYAGGLGSRDPMAMALQQQRAREMLLGGGGGGGAGGAAGGGGAPGAGRPRGRPPLQPRAPPPTTGDVVNLADSD